MFSGFINRFTYNKSSVTFKEKQADFLDKLLKPSQQLKAHFLKSVFFFTAILVLFSCKHQQGLEDPYQEEKGAGGSPGVLALFQLCPLSIWKDTTPAALKTEKLITVFFPRLVTLVYLLLHLSRSPLHVMLSQGTLSSCDQHKRKNASVVCTAVSFLSVTAVGHSYLFSTNEAFKVVLE